MRRGFKSGCELTANRYRKRLGISLQTALPYKDLATELGILLWTAADVPGLDDDTVHQLSVVDADAWSAVTVKLDERHAIVVNAAQNRRRIPNSVAHELAHIILGHSPARVDISEDGHLWLSTYGDEQEREADWLAATLLLPRDGLLQSFARHRDVESVAMQFRVSRELVRWRLNATGVARQVNGRTVDGS
ncbi:MAG TPA: ImmA/IrrE family metallo-endopeptidase [Rhodothermales bacterium]|nr:ImmA/IrrE family metallo-endopeptidase [Rhodothermales bacterium]